MPRRATAPKTSEPSPRASTKTAKHSSTATCASDPYRRLALALPGTLEGSHMGAPDFRVNGRIFATLAYQAKGLGTVKLTAGQQAACLEEAPDYFTPASGKWGQNGTSLVRLDAPEDVIAGALSMAHRNVAQQPTMPKKGSSL